MESLSTTGMMIAAAVGATLAVVAREAWVHWYYPYRGRLYLTLDEPELAAAAWSAYLATRTLAGRRRKLPARFSLAHCLYRLGRADEALAQCERILGEAARSPLLGLARQMQADCLARLGRDDEARVARDAARQAYQECDADSLFARELEVGRLESDGQWRQALSELEQLVHDALRCGSEEYLLALRLRLARARLQRGFYEAAMMTAETLLARAGLPVELRHDAHAVAARSYLELERLDQAQRDAEAAQRVAEMTRDPERLIDDGLTLAEVALHRGDYVTAMAGYQQVRESGHDGRWLAALGEAELLLLWGRAGEAGAALEQARRHLPADPAARESAALVVAVAAAAGLWYDQPAEAAALLEPYLEADIREPRLALRRDAAAAAALAGCGRWPEAAPFRAALEAGRVEFSHDRHLMVEVDQAESYCALKSGRPDLAAEALRQALDRPPYRLLRPLLQVRLGDVLLAAGSADEAAACWREAAAFDIALGAVDDARRRLAELGQA